jgi:hypothetical protein
VTLEALVSTPVMLARLGCEAGVCGGYVAETFSDMAARAGGLRGALDCMRHSIAIANSNPWRSPIPTHGDREFQSMAIARSNAS